MAPIPSTLNEETRSLVESLQRRQKDLSDFQINRLRTCTGPPALQQRYAAELREDIDAFAHQIKNLDIAVDDQRTERDRHELRQIVDEFHAALTSLKKDARAALLASKKAIDSNQLSNREELLRSSAVKEKQNLSEKVAEDALMKANNDVTGALQRTITLMQGELERSVLSSQLLESSTAALRSTSSTHDVLDSLLDTSKHLITALEKSDWLDRLLVLAGLFFFLLVVAFILKQRIVDRSIRIAFWWTRFLPSLSSDEGLLRAEEGKGFVNSLITSALTTAPAVAVSSAAFSQFTTMTTTASEELGPTEQATFNPILEEVITSSSQDPVEVTPSAESDDLLERTAERSAMPSNVPSGMHDEL
ncbi:uncharacterized protein LAESUDRAFT_736621 [Laetiporus sulphureus 93-53]|uniref:Sec20 C-terminal domain-containing protein n=1 Tax=Laetiporus sulphureus 93-53 TaxID=1314785 RepID=A0A165EHT6_9APHY|nr:uncharacterized protein LAESUDRAFT_736621 [Laetiporus sulphureus 93-53]KZT07077.1 hypothetical protein LAESUDRAFT_736621 [Laetiporus sulphureus 93-53]